MEEDWELIKKRSSCIEQLHSSMDRILQQNNIETIKRTMLIHDNMFKQQVQELHRLYSVQKMMMKQVKGSLHTASASSSGDHQDPIGPRSVVVAKRATNNQQPLLTTPFKYPNVNVDIDEEEEEEEEDNKMGLMMVQETDIELTLSIATPTSNNASSSFRRPVTATPQDYTTTSTAVTLGLNTTQL